MRRLSLFSGLLLITSCARTAEQPLALPAIGVVTRATGTASAASTPEIENVLHRFGSQAHVSLEESGNHNEDIARLELFASQEFGSIIAVGSDLAGAVQRVAFASPKRQFVIIDGYADSPNVNSVAIADEQPAFLSGVLSALASKKHRVALIDGLGAARRESFESAFSAGVKEIDPAVALKIATVDDPAGAKVAAQSAVSLGADGVTIAVGGESGAVALAAIENRAHTVAYGFAGRTALATVPDALALATALAVQEAIAQKLRTGPSVVGPREGLILQLNPERSAELDAAQRDRYRRIAEAVLDGRVTPPSTPGALRAFQPNGL